jgi:hypothetical protein
MHLSYSEHVPRYQLHVVHGGRTKDLVVGNLEKSETHLRAKTGELIRAQVWNLTSNALFYKAFEMERDWNPCGREFDFKPLPSANDIQMMGMSIATQAKRYPFHLKGQYEQIRFNPETERWVQTIGISDKAYRLEVGKPVCKPGEPPRAKSLKALRELAIYQVIDSGQDSEDERLICVARKQHFAGALGYDMKMRQVERPYLGVQIVRPDKKAGSLPTSEDNHEAASSLDPMLDTRDTIILLMCLAWSEETMSEIPDMFQRFRTAMSRERGDPGSAEDLGFSPQWDAYDVMQRLRDVPHALLHLWAEEGPSSALDLEEVRIHGQPMPV